MIVFSELEHQDFNLLYIQSDVFSSPDEKKAGISAFSRTSVIPSPPENADGRKTAKKHSPH